MGGLECVITGLMDEFKDFFNRWHINREMFTGMIVSVSFVVALCCVTPVSISTDRKISEEDRFQSRGKSTRTCSGRTISIPGEDGKGGKSGWASIF